MAHGYRVIVIKHLKHKDEAWCLFLLGGGLLLRGGLLLLGGSLLLGSGLLLGGGLLYIVGRRKYEKYKRMCKEAEVKLMRSKLKQQKVRRNDTHTNIH